MSHLPIDRIRPGDILLTKATARSFFVWKLIGFFQVLLGQGGSYHRTYSHAAIYEGEGQVLEMTWPRARRRAYNPDDEEIEIWQINDLSPTQMIILLDSCRSRLGEWYDLMPLVTLGIVGGPRVCSSWLNVGFLKAGIMLSNEGPGDALLTPNEIADSKRTTKKILDAP